MSTTDDLIYYEDQNLPIRDALANIIKNSGKKIIFDSQINGTSSFSINGIPWRKVLESFVQIHDLKVDESEHTIFVQKKYFKKKSPEPLKIQEKIETDLRSDQKLSDSVDLIERELDIKGISGSYNNLNAIVNYRGRNQTWSVGNTIDAKYRVINIEEDGLTLLDLKKKNELMVKFY
tara:strand:- start:1325 stop:1855 length:531 start_codon:yes stop_codon:yes gene_type:complete